uniref:Putative secreted protein n=1 Tax=Anopheles triannulatus TaxID=58253 RepID=A0A2M4B5B8_9DIPT
MAVSSSLVVVRVAVVTVSWLVASASDDTSDEMVLLFAVSAPASVSGTAPVSVVAIGSTASGCGSPVVFAASTSKLGLSGMNWWCCSEWLPWAVPGVALLHGCCLPAPCGAATEPLADAALVSSFGWLTCPFASLRGEDGGSDSLSDCSYFRSFSSCCFFCNNRLISSSRPMIPLISLSVDRRSDSMLDSRNPFRKLGFTFNFIT